MQRRVFLAISFAVLLTVAGVARAAVSTSDAQKFIGGLGSDAISSLTGSGMSTADREARFDALLKANFDMPGISKFVLGRYWKLATPDQQTEFEQLLEKLLTQSYAKAFAQFPQNKAILKSRIAVGSTVIDHEKVVRAPGGEEFEIIAIYSFRDGLIARVDFAK